MDSSSAMLPSSALSLKLLDRVIKMKVNDAVIDYLVQYIIAMVKVEHDDARDALSTHYPSKKPNRPPSSKSLPRLQDFIDNISIRSRCTMATMLVALIYLERLQKVIKLKHPTAGKPCSRHRVMFSALMISHKVWNDSSMIGKHWAEVSNLFTPQEVLAMEREILGLLRYDLELTVEEIWTAAKPFFKKPFLSVDPGQVAEADAYFYVTSKMKHEAMVVQHISHQTEGTPPTYVEPTSLLAQQVAPIHSSPGILHAPSHDSGLVHPYSSLHYSCLSTSAQPLSRAEPSDRVSRSKCSTPAPLFDPFEHPRVYSPALKSSPLLASPLLQTVPHRATAATAGVNGHHGSISFSRMQATRSSAGSTIRATRLTMKNVSHTTVATKGTNAHVYLHNPPQHHHHHVHPVIAPAARLKKRKYIASVQRFHLPTSMHSHPMLRFVHLSSPRHSNPSTGSRSNSGSSFITTSVPSSPSTTSTHSTGSGVSVYNQSPSLVWYAHVHEQYTEPPRRPYYSYASTLTMAPNSNATGA